MLLAYLVIDVYVYLYHLIVIEGAFYLDINSIWKIVLISFLVFQFGTLPYLKIRHKTQKNLEKVFGIIRKNYRRSVKQRAIDETVWVLLVRA